MPRMPKKRKLELSFFLNERGRVTYNDLCRKCQRTCKQSFRAVIVDCPHYLSKRSKRKVKEDTASVSGLRPADGKATRRIPWTGTTRSTLRYGGRAGLTQRTAIWKPSAARSALTFAPMSDRGLIKSPLSTWGQRSASWRKKAYRPTSAT